MLKKTVVGLKKELLKDATSAIHVGKKRYVKMLLSVMQDLV